VTNLMSSEHDAEQRYWSSLPKCIWCSDALPENDRCECDRCGSLACIDHCSTAISGEVICLQCKEDELSDIRKMARSLPLGEDIFAEALQRVMDL